MSKRLDQQKWADVLVIRDLELVVARATEAIISIHRINAINTAGVLDGEPIKPWTDKQYDYIEAEKIARVLSATSVLPRPEDS